MKPRSFGCSRRYTVGFLTYSEGCNDDVNKIVWSGLGWNPDANVTDILREYSRYFIGDRYADAFAQGLLALERNWRGPLTANDECVRHARAVSSRWSAARARRRCSRTGAFNKRSIAPITTPTLARRLIHETRPKQRAMAELRNATAAWIASGDECVPNTILDRTMTGAPARGAGARASSNLPRRCFRASACS